MSAPERKKSQSFLNQLAEIERQQVLYLEKAALQPAFEGTTYATDMRATIDFVNVTETTDPTQG